MVQFLGKIIHGWQLMYGLEGSPIETALAPTDGNRPLPEVVLDM